MIRKCSECGDYRSEAAKFQDEKYGKGNRVFNPQQGKNRGHWRCTVCGKSVQVASK